MAKNLSQRAVSKRYPAVKPTYFDAPNIGRHVTEVEANVNPTFPGKSKSRSNRKRGPAAKGTAGK